MARRIAVLRDPAVSSQAHLAELESAGRSLNLVLDIIEIQQPEEIAADIQRGKLGGADAINVLASPMLNGAAGLIAAVARDAQLPTICQWREMAEAGCVLSYGPPLRESYELTAKQMDRVLRGARPADLPVEQPTLFELIVNKKAASAIGLMLDPALVYRADEVIE
jgi:putative ABC transport system substrate-binding protein